MPTFSYTALDLGGSEVTGTLRAPDETTARRRLREEGYRLLQLEVRTSWLSVDLRLPWDRAIGPRERGMMARQLATLLEAGVPLLRALNILEEQVDRRPLRGILRRVGRDVETGASLSEALAAHPETFDELFVNTVRAGEAGDVLARVLERLAEMAETQRELRNRLRSATLYPLVLFGLTVGVVIFLLTAVLPAFTALYREMGVPLPVSTRIMLAGGEFVRRWWYLLVLAPAAGWYGFRSYYGSETGRHRVDRLLLKLPLFGQLVGSVAAARFTRILGTLLESGVPLLRAMDIARDTLGNRAVADLMNEVIESVRDGGTVSGPLHDSDAFEPMVAHMIAVGERTGQLSEVLHRIADTSRTRVEVRVKELSSLLEPLLIVVLGLAVGMIVLAMYVPLFRLMQVVG